MLGSAPATSQASELAQSRWLGASLHWLARGCTAGMDQASTAAVEAGRATGLAGRRALLAAACLHISGTAAGEREGRRGGGPTLVSNALSAAGFGLRDAHCPGSNLRCFSSPSQDMLAVWGAARGSGEAMAGGLLGAGGAVGAAGGREELQWHRARQPRSTIVVLRRGRGPRRSGHRAAPAALRPLRCWPQRRRPRSPLHTSSHGCWVGLRWPCRGQKGGCLAAHVTAHLAAHRSLRTSLHHSTSFPSHLCKRQHACTNRSMYD